MHDLVIRGGVVVDGTGAPAVEGDVAVDGDRIVAVGRVVERGREEIDADGAAVTPGFVDVHTHYDGQVTWDPQLLPSVWHGVTTVVMGNCGVGFAPAAPERHDWLIGLMEGVEGIPGASLRAGIEWTWESVPEYLDALDRLPLAVDVAAQIAHGPVRAYVMGERGAANEAPTADDLARMAAIVEAGVRAGAVGISINRLPLHKAVDGREVPGTYAEEDELFALGRAVRAGAPARDAVIALILPTASGFDRSAWPRELDWMTRLSVDTGLAFTFAFGNLDHLPDLERANAVGARLVPQIACRLQGCLLGLRTRHVFETKPSFRAIADLPPAEQARRMADPEFKVRVLAETPVKGRDRLAELVLQSPDAIFPLPAPHAQEPTTDESVAALAARTGRPPVEVLWDLTMADDGQSLVMWYLGGYPNGSLEPSRVLMERPDTVLGLGDGGAHVDLICDAGYPTFVLGYWARERTKGERLSIETAVRVLTSEPAKLYSLHDRGVVAPGRRADLNLIDLDRVALRPMEIRRDLPAGARRIVQGADGYLATVVAGQVVQRDGADTGVRPGGLARRWSARRAI
jgi:N-acyl-D-aspartate/D-glutamate deacylase